MNASKEIERFQQEPTSALERSSADLRVPAPRRQQDTTVRGAHQVEAFSYSHQAVVRAWRGQRLPAGVAPEQARAELAQGDVRFVLSAIWEHLGRPPVKRCEPGDVENACSARRR